MVISLPILLIVNKLLKYDLFSLQRLRISKSHETDAKKFPADCLRFTCGYKRITYQQT